jgi:hypothetical protein
MRCLILARAIKKHWPASYITFALHKEAGYFQDHPFDVVTFSGDHKSKEFQRTRARIVYEAIVGETRPDVVFFDGSGRTVHYLAAWLKGVNVVIISSRKGTHESGFRLGRLLSAKQHWMIQDIPGIPSMNSRQNFLGTLFSVRLVDLPTVYNSFTDHDVDAVFSSNGLKRGKPLILFTPGGGGFVINGRRAVDIFLEAAQIVTERIGVTSAVLSLTAPESRIPENDGVRYISLLDNREFMALVDYCSLCVMGGGSVISQVLACGKTGVAVPIGRLEQNNRVDACRRLGTVVASPPEPMAMAQRVIDLYRDTERKETMIARAATLGIVNGVNLAIRALEELV